MLRNARFKGSFLIACLCICVLITMPAATIACSSTAEITINRARERTGVSNWPLVMFESKSQAPLDGFENHAPGASGVIVPAGTNDNFADAQSLSGFSGTVTGNNVGYTREVGEPSHSHLESRESAWYVW